MNLAQVDHSIQFTLNGILKVILYNKIIFTITSIVSLVIIFGLFLMITPIYEGSTLMIVGQINFGQRSESIRSNPESNTSLARIAESEEVVSHAIDNIGIVNFSEISTQPSMSIFQRLRGLLYNQTNENKIAVSAIQAALPMIKSNLNVRPEPNTDIIRIAFKNKSPQLAAKFSNAVAQAFLDRQLALFSTPGAVEFFFRQKQRFDAEFQQASDELEKFATSTATYSADDQRQLLLKRMNDLSAALALTRTSISEKSGQRQALSDELKRLSPVARSNYVSSLVNALSDPLQQIGCRFQ